MANVKKYIITAVVLGIVAMASGVLIGVTNLLTADRIAINKKESINKGIREIYGESVSVSDPIDIKGEFDKVTAYYEVKQNDVLTGYAFQTEGSNNYGKISVIVGFVGEENTFKAISVITNEQTYASDLVENYINPLNDGTRVYTDVSCGATYGATTIKQLIDSAKQAVAKYGVWNNG